MTTEQLHDKKQIFKDPKLIKERMIEYFKKYTIPDIPYDRTSKNFGEIDSVIQELNNPLFTNTKTQ